MKAVGVLLLALGWVALKALSVPALARTGVLGIAYLIACLVHLAVANVAGS